MTEIAVIIEALFNGDRMKALSYMQLFVEKHHHANIRFHQRSDEEFLANRINNLLQGYTEDNHACLDKLPEIITITEIPIDEIIESWKNRQPP
ncbi:MAG: hypothetical protein LCH91_05325 [Bacteroidetes bacterium]|nr:hypothetical protein [Bacteroidota bacterium]